MPLYYIKI